MAQVTQNERDQHISAMLKQRKADPPHTDGEVRIEVGGQSHLCPVITAKADMLLLNHNSHRIRSQLQDDPRWSELTKEPHSDAAQKVVAEYVKGSRSLERFEELKVSLLRGQQEPGIITRRGVLINANTRAVAIREFEDPSKRLIQIAVLPENVNDQGDLSILELRLQMQREYKEDYTFTNHLLFIEEMEKEHGMSASQIAVYMGIKEKDVKQRLQILDLIRQMQKMPDEPLKLTFFDEVALQQLVDLQSTYESLINKGDASGARKQLQTWLISVAAGVTNVHALRQVDGDFISLFAVPNLEDEDDIVAGAALKIVLESRNTDIKESPVGADELSGEDEKDAGSADDEPDLSTLLNLVTQRENTITVPAQPGVTPVQVQKKDLAQAIGAAITIGTKDKKREVNKDKKIETPAANLKQAREHLKVALDALTTVHADDDFKATQQKSVGFEFDKLRKAVKDAGDRLTTMGIPIK